MNGQKKKKVIQYYKTYNFRFFAPPKDLADICSANRQAFVILNYRCLHQWRTLGRRVMARRSGVVTPFN